MRSTGFVTTVDPDVTTIDPEVTTIDPDVTTVDVGIYQQKKIYLKIN